MSDEARYQQVTLSVLQVARRLSDNSFYQCDWESRPPATKDRFIETAARTLDAMSLSSMIGSTVHDINMLMALPPGTTLEDLSGTRWAKDANWMWFEVGKALSFAVEEWMVRHLGPLTVVSMPIVRVALAPVSE